LELKEPSAKYLARPRYKQTEVGRIPEDWAYERLTSVAKLESGHTPSRRNGAYWGGSIPWISLHDTDALDEREIRDTAQLITPEGLANSSARLLPAGTVVFSRTATVGKATVMGRAMATSQDFANYICGPRVNNHFLVYLFRGMTSEWKRLMAGSIHNTVYMPVFKALRVPLPPVQEQEAIANALNDEDLLIKSLERLLAKKRQIKQGAMQELLTGKRRLPGFSGEWEVKALGELFTFSGGLSASRDQLSAEGHCYLHYGDIHLSSRSFIDVHSEFQDIPKLNVPLNKVAAKSLLADGDVVFVDASEDNEGASKHVVVVNPDTSPFISGLHTIVAKGKSAELDHLYRRYCFQTRAVKGQFRFFAVGTKVSGISKTNIAKVTMPLPSVAEQTAIAGILSDMDADIAAMEEKLGKARHVKQGMMQELLTGRIRLV
jgi:type I restriction enzyme S subunit